MAATRCVRFFVFFAAAMICFAQWKTETWIRRDAAPVSAAEARAFLEMICPGHSSDSGCSVCPDPMPQSAQTWDLRSITFGHFLSARSEDALVSGFGCEPHANMMSGSFLFTRSGAGWRRVRYLEGVNAFDCRKLPGVDGRDRLVCAASDQHQGVLDQFLYLLDPGRDPATADADALKDTTRGDFFFYVEDTLGSCVALPDGFVESGAIERVDFDTMPDKRHVRIIITARLGKAIVPAKLLQDCDVEDVRLTVVTVPRRYEFVFDGSRAVASPGNPPTTEQGLAIAPKTSYTARPCTSGAACRTSLQ